MQNIPLAERIRPKKLPDVIGQKHLIGNKRTLKTAISNKLIPSMILWGPPGVGKTTLASLIAEELDRPFYTLSAINSGVKDVREVIQKASSLGLFGKDVLNLKLNKKKSSYWIEKTGPKSKMKNQF